MFDIDTEAELQDTPVKEMCGVKNRNPTTNEEIKCFSLADWRVRGGCMHEHGSGGKWTSCCAYHKAFLVDISENKSMMCELCRVAEGNKHECQIRFEFEELTHGSG